MDAHYYNGDYDRHHPSGDGDRLADTRRAFWHSYRYCVRTNAVEEFLAIYRPLASFAALVAQAEACRCAVCAAWVCPDEEVCVTCRQSVAEPSDRPAAGAHA